MTSIFRRPQPFAMLAAALFLAASARAQAQIAVSANDGKAVLVNGVVSVSKTPVPDNVLILDLSAKPPKILGELEAPASVVGPPVSVALAPDESYALVTAAARLDPADPTKTVPDDRLTVIDLKAVPPRALATVQVGKGAAGVSINRAGNLALVANRSEGSVSVLAIAGSVVTPVEKITLGSPTSGPSHAIFSRDGKSAFVTRDGDHKISILSVDGQKVEYTKRDMNAGIRPYGLDVSSMGDIAIVANLGGSSGDADTMSVIDVRASPPRIVETVTVGLSPEGLKLSPDGNFVALSLVNGTNAAKTSPFFSEKGIVQVWRVEGTRLTKVASAPIGQWCQGIVWSGDGKSLLVQCMVESEIMTFDFDGTALKPSGAIKTKGGPAGIRTAEP